MTEDVCAEKIEVQVCYATPEKSVILNLELSLGVTLEQAIIRSGILAMFPEIDLARTKVGIFGKLKSLASDLRSGDRVEIYRALVADPMEARRRRAIKHATRL